MSELELDWARHLLIDWARWLGRAGGYAPSSIEGGWHGGGSGVWGSRIPLGVEPSFQVARSSRAMQHLRALDGRAAAVLEAVYLRRAQITLKMLARENGIGLTAYQARRCEAERKFLGLFQALASGSSERASSDGPFKS